MRNYTDYKHSDLTQKIIHYCYKVYNTLGSGFLEKVYENALKLELVRNKLETKQQFPIVVFYQGEVVGEYFADLLVEHKVILELKAICKLEKFHEVQLVNYLKATEVEIGLLINFGPTIQIKRRIHTKKYSVNP